MSKPGSVEICTGLHFCEPRNTFVTFPCSLCWHPPEAAVYIFLRISNTFSHVTFTFSYRSVRSQLIVFSKINEKSASSLHVFFFTWFFGLSFGGLKTGSLHIPNKTLYEASYQANWLLQKSHPYRDKWVKRTRSIRITDTFNLVLWYLVRYCTKNCAKNCVKNSPLFVNNMSHQLCKKE